MNAGGQLHGVTESLQHGASVAGTVSDNIHAHRVALRPVVDAMKGQWEGRSRPAFDAAHAQWEAGIARLTSALNNLGDNTRVSANGYDMADQNSTSGIQAAMGLSPFGGALQG